MPEHEEKRERSDINIRTVFKFGIALLATAVFVQVLMWAIFWQLDRRQTKLDPQLSPLAPKERQLPAEPRLQVTPAADLQTIRKLEYDTLHSYGWVDEKGAVVRIPIDVAMRLIVERETTKALSHEGEKEK